MDMMTYNLLPILYDKLIIFMLIFTRISAMFSAFVVFRKDYVSPRILVSLSALLSFIVLLTVQTNNLQGDLMSLKIIVLMALQVFIGFITAFVVNVIFEIFSGVGQIIAIQIGISMASLVDPRFGSITVLAHLYVFVATIIFFMLDGHLQIIQLLMNSFIAIPCDQAFLPVKFIPNLLKYSGIIFSQAVLLSIVVIIATMLSNLCLGVMSKFAPQFNIFSIGININLVLGLILVYISFHMFTERGQAVIQDGLAFLKLTLAKMS